MTNFLQKVMAEKQAYVMGKKAEKPIDVMDEEARNAPPARGFAKALRAKISVNDIGLITEIKKASPSAGLIRGDFSPKQLARDYESGGAACLSVLTDTPYFQGSDNDLIEARAACTLPVLRKDFMVDVWQVAEARAMGADCILVVMAALSTSRAEDLYYAGIDYGMDVLLEVHNRVELDRALMLPSGIIGINNRNLSTLKVDLGTTEELVVLVPPDRLVVSESGLSKPSELARIQKLGIHCFLVGESLLKQPDVTTATLQLRLG